MFEELINESILFTRFTHVAHSLLAQLPQGREHRQLRLHLSLVLGKYANDGVKSRQRHACTADARPAVDSEALRLLTLLHLRVFTDQELGGRLEHFGEAFDLGTLREVKVYDREL